MIKYTSAICFSTATILQASTALAQRRMPIAPTSHGSIWVAVGFAYFIFGPCILLMSLVELLKRIIKGGYSAPREVLDLFYDEDTSRAIWSGMLTALPFIFIWFHLFGFGDE